VTESLAWLRLQIAIDLIRELIRSTNPLKIKRERILRLQTETEERLSNINVIGYWHSKWFPEVLPSLNVMGLSLAIESKKPAHAASGALIDC
jgi:hypothetical protein